MTARQKSSGCAGSSLQPKRANKNFRQDGFPHGSLQLALICLQRVIFSFPFFNLFALIRDLGLPVPPWHSLGADFIHCEQFFKFLWNWVCDSVTIHCRVMLPLANPMSNPEACFMVRLGKLQKQRRVPRRKLEQFEVTKVRCSWRQRQKAYASYWVISIWTREIQMRSYRSHGANWLICCSLDLWLCKAARLLREARVEVNRLKARAPKTGAFWAHQGGETT